MVVEKIRAAIPGQHRLPGGDGLLEHFSNRTITRVLYIEVLKKFYGYFHPLELTINRFSEINAYLPDFYQRRKSNALMEDLRTMDGLFGEPATCSALPVIDSAGKAFGCLYAMEETTLGGSIIAGIVREELGIDNDSGGRFFNAYGNETNDMWRIFRQAINLFSTQYNNDDDIICGAADTFTGLHAWMKN